MSISSIEPLPVPSDDATLYELRKELFKAAMNRKWQKVLELYRNEKVQGEHITHANDTLLHVAISGAEENEVLDLLKIVNDNKDLPTILKIKNKTGDTPLHLAAALGQDKVCKMIAKMCPDMVTSERNDLQETPLFSAVRHGNKNAFFELEFAILKEQNLTIDEICLSKRDITHCRRDDGNNILHYAIKGDQFGTITEPLKYHFVNFMEEVSKAGYDELPGILPENKVLPPICIDIFSLMKKSICCLFNTDASCSKIGIYKACCDDVENPSSSSEPVAASSSSKTASSSEPVDASISKIAGAQEEPRRMFPQNYDMMILFFKMIVKLLLVVLGIGLTRLQTIRIIKQQHRNAKKIMKELVERSTLWVYEEASGGKEPDDESPTVINGDTHIRKDLPPQNSLEEATDQGSDEKAQKPSEVHESSTVINEATHIGPESPPGKTQLEDTDQASPVLVAAKSGITEMVKTILKRYPVAVMDRDKDNKNIILLAVEHRQVNVYKYMLDVPTVKTVFWKVDKDENSVLHLAAKLSHSQPLSIPRAAFLMQWESKWYKSRSELNQAIFSRINKDGKKPEDVFIETHYSLAKDGSTWLAKTSESRSVVAIFIATVAYASASTVPGGVDQSGYPVLSKNPVFQLFAISSLVALCFSVTSLIMFLAILFSQYEVLDFNTGLSVNLFLGQTSLFMSIASMLVSFCAGYFFVVENKLKFAVYPIYAIMCFPVIFFAVSQLPLYTNLIKATIMNVPERLEKVHVY